jgi:F-type H+-transporting ATPase subunit c
MLEFISLATNASHMLTSADQVVSYAPIGRGIAFGFAAGGAGIGIGLVFASAIQGIARQPEQAGTLRTLMFVGFGLIEMLALLGLVMNYLIK